MSKSLMDKVSEKATDILASAPVIICFTIWMIAHNIIVKSYVAFISDVAIEIGLLILRAENLQQERLERKIDKR